MGWDAGGVDGSGGDGSEIKKAEAKAKAKDTVNTNSGRRPFTPKSPMLRPPFSHPRATAQQPGTFFVW